ncbi:hypothetical protein Ciccas_002472 [Cichlidogyrus casuarinus]|uniref:Uncharacterized protein n=1 Tax=Cichlidogyrus casuarinus TaxID=1844966 RepID=A0ABD2QHD1_9PLAT
MKTKDRCEMSDKGACKLEEKLGKHLQFVLVEEKSDFDFESKNKPIRKLRMYPRRRNLVVKETRGNEWNCVISTQLNFAAAINKCTELLENLQSLDIAELEEYILEELEELVVYAISNFGGYYHPKIEKCLPKALELLNKIETEEWKFSTAVKKNRNPKQTKNPYKGRIKKYCTRYEEEYSLSQLEEFLKTQDYAHKYGKQCLIPDEIYRILEGLVEAEKEVSRLIKCLSNELGTILKDFEEQFKLVDDIERLLGKLKQNLGREEMIKLKALVVSRLSLCLNYLLGRRQEELSEKMITCMKSLHLEFVQMLFDQETQWRLVKENHVCDNNLWKDMGKSLIENGQECSQANEKDESSGPLIGTFEETFTELEKCMEMQKLAAEKEEKYLVPPGICRILEQLAMIMYLIESLTSNLVVIFDDLKEQIALVEEIKGLLEELNQASDAEAKTALKASIVGKISSCHKYLLGRCQEELAEKFIEFIESLCLEYVKILVDEEQSWRPKNHFSDNKLWKDMKKFVDLAEKIDKFKACSETKTKAQSAMDLMNEIDEIKLFGSKIHEEIKSLSPVWLIKYMDKVTRKKYLSETKLMAQIEAAAEMELLHNSGSDKEKLTHMFGIWNKKKSSISKATKRLAQDPACEYLSWVLMEIKTTCTCEVNVKSSLTYV